MPRKPTFRVQRCKFWLTYPRCETAKEALYEHLCSIGPLKEYCVAQETHTDGAHHLHAWVQFKDKVNSRNERLFDVDGHHPHIKKGTDRKTRLNYCHKEDPEPLTNIKDFDMEKDYVDLVDGTIDINEFIRLHPKSLPRIKQIKEGLTVLRAERCFLDPEPLENLYPWQEELMKKLNEKTNDRTVNWYWSEEGNVGKSAMAMHIYSQYPTVYFDTITKQSDFAHAIYTTFSTSAKPPEVVIFDLPRRVEYNDILCDQIKRLKNGVVRSTKYAGGLIMFKVPHVIVFSRFLPDEKMLSVNRWNIVRI